MLMLLALAVLLDQSSITFDVTGMPPQLSLIRNEAAKHSWKIVCEGRSGEERVLRLRADGAAAKKLNEYFENSNHLGSRWELRENEKALQSSCDHVPPVVSGTGEAVRVLAAGLHAEVEPSLKVARDCGYKAAIIRPWRGGDIGGVSKPKDEKWYSLDVREDAPARYGPSVCFIQMLHLNEPPAEVAPLF